MSFNNAPLIHALEQATEEAPPPRNTLAFPVVRRRVTSAPCLPERLPNSSFLHREAQYLAPNALQKELSSSHSRQGETDHSDEKPLKVSTDVKEEVGPPKSPSSPRSATFFKSIARSISGFSTSSSQTNRGPISIADVQPFEIMKAVEESNITFLMEVRDKAFPLLLRTSGGQTPLVHAIRIGNKDVAIVLLGAFSRYINYLDDADIVKPQTQSQLKALRTGLKLAINQGLANSQPDLIASFMQTLIMSEGDKWVWAQVSNVSRELNAGADGKPVALAGFSVRKFATRELGKADLIASLEDYIANATADLLMMGAWTVVLEYVSADHIPSSYFARDDRVYKAFASQLEHHQNEIDRKCPRQLRLQLGVLKDGFEGRSTTFRKKVDSIALQLDNGEV